MSKKQELILDLVEYNAYRSLQIPSSEGSEDAYFKMMIQSLEEALLFFEEEIQPKHKGHRKPRKKVRRKKDRARDRQLSYIQGLRKTSNRKVRYQKPGRENFKLRGSSYQNVLPWTWEM